MYQTYPNSGDLGAAIGGAVLFGMIIYLAIFIIFVAAYWQMFKKAGYSGALSLLLLVPLVNIVMILWFGFSEWPVVRENRELRSRMTGGGLGGPLERQPPPPYSPPAYTPPAPPAVRPPAPPCTAPPTAHRAPAAHRTYSRRPQPPAPRPPTSRRPRRSAPPIAEPAAAPELTPPPAPPERRAARGQLGEDAPDDRGPRGESLAVHSHRARPVGLGVRRDQGGADGVRPRSARAASLRHRLAGSRGLRAGRADAPACARRPAEARAGRSHRHHHLPRGAQLRRAEGQRRRRVTAHRRGPRVHRADVGRLPRRAAALDRVDRHRDLVRRRGADLVRRGRRASRSSRLHCSCWSRRSPRRPTSSCRRSRSPGTRRWR